MEDQKTSQSGPNSTGQAPVPIPKQGPSPHAPEPASRRSLTFGEKAVGITFNASKLENVEKIKRLSAALIDELDMQRAQLKEKGRESHPEDGEVAAQYTLAIRSVQVGQMWGVKAATWLLDK